MLLHEIIITLTGSIDDIDDLGEPGGCLQQAGNTWIDAGIKHSNAHAAPCE